MVVTSERTKHRLSDHRVGVRVTTGCRCPLPVLVGALITVLPLSAQATTITFLEPLPNDARGNIAILVNGDPPPGDCPAGEVKTVCVGSGGTVLRPERARIDLRFPKTFFASDLHNVQAARALIVEGDIAESHISDIVTVNFFIPTEQTPWFAIDVLFQSDAAESPLSPGTIPPNFQFAVIENGEIQQIPLNRFFTGSLDDPRAAGLPFGLDIEFQSDTADVAEPSTFVLSALGLMVCAVAFNARSRRLRRQA